MEAAEAAVIAAAKNVRDDWVAVCTLHPVNHADPRSLHPHGPGIAWQSLYDLSAALELLAESERKD